MSERRKQRGNGTVIVTEVNLGLFEFTGCSREASSVPCRYLLASSHLLLHITSSSRAEGRRHATGGGEEVGRRRIM